MTARRALLWTRLLTGAGFLYQGWAHFVEPWETTALLHHNAGWRSWPLLEGARPLEVTLWLSLVEFFLGVFVFGGLLTRILAMVAIAVAGFQLVVFGGAGGLLNVLLLAGSAAIAVGGGGAGTMDASLGLMQRRALERETARRRGRGLGAGC